MEILMLPAKDPWSHPWYDAPDAFVDVAFEVDAPEQTIDQIVSFDLDAARGP